MSLQYCLCETAGLSNFSMCAEYIRYSDSNEKGFGIYINNKKQLEVVADNKFIESKKLHEIKEVVSIYSNELIPTIVGKTYQVYKTNNKDYQILTENLKLEEIKSNYFIELKDFKKMNKNEFDTLIEEMKKEFEESSLKAQKEKEERDKLQQIQENRENQLEIIKKICKQISKHGIISKTTTITTCPKFVRIFYLLSSIFLFISSVFIENVFMAICCMCMFGFYFIFLLNYNEVIINEEYDIDIIKYEQLKFMNKLPLELLGKIKQIENEIIILNYMKVDDEVLRLFQESINLALYISTNEEYYLNNKKIIDVKILEFLDTNLEYIETLKTNRKLEKDYINTTIAKNIIQMIDENNALFKDMIKDNHYLIDIFKED